jgi:hypothetical protein
MLIIVCIGLFLSVLLCSWIIIVAACGISMSLMYVACKFDLWYVVISYLCFCVYPCSG